MHSYPWLLMASLLPRPLSSVRVAGVSLVHAVHEPREGHLLPAPHPQHPSIQYRAEPQPRSRHTIQKIQKSSTWKRSTHAHAGLHLCFDWQPWVVANVGERTSPLCREWGSWDRGPAEGSEQQQQRV